MPEMFERLKPYLKDYEVDSARVELTRAAVLLRLLTSIREYLEFGVGNLASSKETFNSLFAKNLARWNVEFSFYINSVRTDHAMFRRRISVDVCWVGCA